MTTEKQREEFEQLTIPLIKWLNENTHPHAKIIIDTSSAELLSAECSLVTEEYWVD